MMIACSGPEAGRHIQYAIDYGNVSAVVTFALLIIASAFRAIRQQNYWAMLVFFMPLTIHPAWTISADHGDCGALKVFASTAWTIVAVILALSAIFRTRRPREEQKTPSESVSIWPTVILTTIFLIFAYGSLGLFLITFPIYYLAIAFRLKLI